MYQIKLVVDSYERWLTGLHYEYFCPIEVDKAYYRKFLQKNFPYEMGDAYNLHPYTHKLPLVKWSQLDERLQQDCMRQAQSDFYQTTPNFSNLCLGEFGESDTKKVGYYNTLAMARHKAGLDYGIVPNYTHNYDKYLSPVQNITARTTYNKIGGLFSLELNSSENDDYLYEWLLTSQMRQGKLVFYDGDGDQAFKIEFWDCFCIGVQENMSAEGNTAMKMNVRLSPAITRNRSAEHQKVWKVTDITPTNRAFGPSSVSEEPAEEKQKDKLLVKKVEGPFFENGQVAEEMIEGNTYIYKATEYTQAEGDKLALTQWAEQLSDDGQITNIRGAKSYLDNDGVICFKYKAKKAEKIRIYAYVESAAEKVSVKVPVVLFPFCVDRFRMPGLNSEGKDIAEDLTYGKGVNITKKVYPSSDVKNMKSNYIAGKEFGLTALSNGNTNYKKAIYSSEEIYRLDYDYSAMNWKTKIPFFPIEKIASGIRWVDSKLRDVPDGVSAGSLVKYFNEHYTDEELFAGFKDLVTTYMAKDELEENIIAMIRKFKRNEGGVYESDLLTKNIENHPSTNTYCEELQDYIAEKLKNSKGKISDLIEKEIDWSFDEGYYKRRKKGKTTTRKNDKGEEIFFLRPQFNSTIDLIDGQRIALNDIWATDVNISEYIIEGDAYTIKYNVTLWDHFGLDSPDLQKWFNLIGRARAVFAAWFTLQHLRGYKPFITKMQFSKEFSGVLSEGKHERVKRRNFNERMNRIGNSGAL